MLRSCTAGLSVVCLSGALIAGEWCGFSFQCMAWMWPWACCFVVVMLLAWFGWNIRALRWPVAVLAGLALAWRCESSRLRIEERSHSQCSDGLPPSYELCVEGEVSSRTRRRNGDRIVSFQSSIDGLPVRVVARMDSADTAPRPDETWRCHGWLSQKGSAPNRYSCRTLWVLERGHMELVSKPSRSAVRTAYRETSDCASAYANLGLGWNRELAATNMAMLLGRRSGIKADMRNVFAAAGTMHVFAISGLHVMLVAGLLSMLLKKIGLSPPMQAAVCIPLLSAYVMLTGARPSAVRAALMMSLWLGSGLFGRKPDSLVALGLSAMIVYGISPAMIFDVGCGLSFAVMLGILLWVRWSSQFAAPFALAFEKVSEDKSLGGIRGVWRAAFYRYHGRMMWALGMLGVSLSSWIASTPISATVFGRISIGGLIANVIVVPLATMSVLFSAIGIAASIVAKPIGAMFNNLAACCTWIMEWVSETIARCPGASFETCPWSWRECVVWYAAWIALFVVLSRRLPPRERMPTVMWHH